MTSKIGRAEMTDVIEEAAIVLGVGSSNNVLLKSLAVLLFLVAVEETQRPGRLPDKMVESAFDVAVEYMAMALTTKGVSKDV